MFQLFGKAKKNEAVPLPPPGIGELIVCVFDEQQQLLHHFCSIRDTNQKDSRFLLLNKPEQAFESCILNEAVSTRLPVSIALCYGEGRRKLLYVLPHEIRRGIWRFACMQIASEERMADPPASSWFDALAEHRACFVLINEEGVLQAAGPEIVPSFGYTRDILTGMHISDFFNDADVQMIASSPADVNTPIQNRVFHCLDGSSLDVEVQKYALPGEHILLGIRDVTRPVFSEDVTAVTERDRRRIGQDLHDSIGQVLTGISLLSRSLSNDLRQTLHSGEADAALISELADDASNQIRQISRGLMSSDIIQRGFHSSLRELARVTSLTGNVCCEVELDETVEFLDGVVETHLFRIAQEAVNNAVRHANASRIDIVVYEEDGCPAIKICDDGMWKKPVDAMSGIGMKSMKYRASVIGAQLRINSGNDTGTHVVCRLIDDQILS